MSELLEKVAALLEERKNYGISGDSRLSDWRWRAAAELPNVAEELRVALLQNGELVALVKKIDAFFENPKIIPMRDTLILDIPYEIAAGVKAIVTDSSLKPKCEIAPEHPFTGDELKALQDSPFKGPDAPWPTEKRKEGS